MSEPLGVEERARLRALVRTDGDYLLAEVDELAAAVPALLDEVDRLAEELEAAGHEVVRWKQVADVKHRACADSRARAERAEADLAAAQRVIAGLAADLADEKRRHADLRAGVQAVIADRYAGDFNPLIPKLAALLEETP